MSQRALEGPRGSKSFGESLRERELVKDLVRDIEIELESEREL